MLDYGAKMRDEFWILTVIEHGSDVPETYLHEDLNPPTPQPPRSFPDYTILP